MKGGDMTDEVGRYTFLPGIRQAVTDLRHVTDHSVLHIYIGDRQWYKDKQTELSSRCTDFILFIIGSQNELACYHGYCEEGVLKFAQNI